MFDTAAPRPPRLDVTLVFLVAMMLASGLAFFAICNDAHASSRSSSAGWVTTNSTTLAGGAGGAGSAFNAAGNGGSITITAGHASVEQFVDDSGTHLFGETVDVNGDLVVTMETLFRALKGAVYFHDARYVTREAFAEHENDLAVCMTIAAVGGGAAGAGVAALFGLTLFSRTFAMRRWISRAHRELEQKKMANGATHF
jgi:hypothetical protein